MKITLHLIKSLWATVTDPHLLSSRPHHGEDLYPRKSKLRSLYKTKMIQSIIKLNPTAKPLWLDQFNTTELHMYYRRLLSINGYRRTTFKELTHDQS